MAVDPGAADRGLAIAVYVLLGVQVLLNVLRLIAYWRTARAADEALGRSREAGSRGVADQDLDAVDSAMVFADTAAALAEIAFVVTGVVAIVWFHQARANIGLFGLHRPTLGVGWAVGGWFCPVVNLWFPARIASDIWKGSDSRNRWERIPLIAGWWLLAGPTYILTAFFGVDSVHSAIGVDSLTRLRDESRVAMAGSAVTVAAAVLFLLVVLRITTMQQQRERELWEWSRSLLWSPGPWPGYAVFPAAGAGNVPPPPLNPAAAPGTGENNGSRRDVTSGAPRSDFHADSAGGSSGP
jgi:hypothetical protein